MSQLNRVKQYVTAVAGSGLGNLTLGSAVVGNQLISSASDAVSGRQYSYAIEEGSTWEAGVGTWTAPSTFTRDTCIDSSSGPGVKVAFTNAATFFVTELKDDIGPPVGSVVFATTSQSLSIPDYVQPATVYLQASYPGLYKQLGVTSATLSAPSTYSYDTTNYSGGQIFYGLGRFWRLMRYEISTYYDDPTYDTYYTKRFRVDTAVTPAPGTTQPFGWTIGQMDYSFAGWGSAGGATATDGVSGNIAFGPTQAVAVFNRHVYVSTGGAFTKYANSLPAGVAFTVVYALGKFVAISYVSGNYAIYSATDPTGTWTQETASIGGSPYAVGAIVGNATSLTIFTGQDTGRYTTNLSTWGNITVGWSTGQYTGGSFCCSFVLDGYFWVAGQGTAASQVYGRILKSSDGIAWTEVMGASLTSQPTPLGSTGTAIRAVYPIPGTSIVLITGSFASGYSGALLETRKLGVNSNNGQVIQAYSSSIANLSNEAGYLGYYPALGIYKDGSFYSPGSGSLTSPYCTAYSCSTSPNLGTEFKTPSITAPTGTFAFIKA